MRREFLAALLQTEPAKGDGPTLLAQSMIWFFEGPMDWRLTPGGIDEAFAATRRAGFVHVELVYQYVGEALQGEAIRALRRHHLDAADGARQAELRGVVLNISPKPKDAPKTDTELAVQARRLEDLASQLRRRGLSTLYHHHTQEMRDGAREWSFMLHHTSVPACVDRAI